MHFNTAVTFPWLLLARPLGFREREFFSAEGDTAPPQVSFAFTLQEQIRSNRFRSAVVVAGFTVLLLLVAGLIGLVLDVSLAVVAPAAALYGIFGLWRSRGMIAGMTGAHEVASGELASLRRLVENVSIAAGLPRDPRGEGRRRPGAERVRRRPAAAEELRRRHDGPALDDARTGARGDPGARGRASATATRTS